MYCLKPANKAHPMSLSFCYIFRLNAQKFRKRLFIHNIVGIIIILSTITTFFLVLVIALWEEVLHFFQCVLKIYQKKKKNMYSDDGTYIIGWDREICFPSLELYAVYVTGIASFQKRAGKNQQRIKTLDVWSDWLSSVGLIMCCKFCLYETSFEEKMPSFPIPILIKLFAIELSLIDFILRH